MDRVPQLWLSPLWVTSIDCCSHLTLQPGPRKHLDLGQVLLCQNREPRGPSSSPGPRASTKHWCPPLRYHWSVPALQGLLICPQGGGRNSQGKWEWRWCCLVLHQTQSLFLPQAAVERGRVVCLRMGLPFAPSSHPLSISYQGLWLATMAPQLSFPFFSFLFFDGFFPSCPCSCS